MLFTTNIFYQNDKDNMKENQDKELINQKYTEMYKFKVAIIFSTRIFLEHYIKTLKFRYDSLTKMYFISEK